MSYISIWVHCVWTTKNRLPLLKDNIRYKIFDHILENARMKGIHIDHLNGYYEHLHALISLGGSQTIADIMQKIKGESSFWINKNRLTKVRFEWQDDYYAVSADMCHLRNLRTYILNQEQHHRKENFEVELTSILEEYRNNGIRD